MLVLLILLAIAYVALHYSPVQTWLVKKVSDNLSEKLHTEVKVEHVDIDFFKNITAEGVLVKDLKKDTLISVGRLSGKMNDWFFLKDTININNVLLSDVVVNLNRTDSVWNYKFLVDYFSSPKTNKKKTSSNFNIDLNELHFKNIKYNKIDKWIGDDMIGSIGKLDLVMDKLDLNKKLISIKEIILDKPYFAQNDYDGNKPPNFNKKTKIIVADTNKFDWNKEQWNISLAKLTLTDGTYKNDKQSSYKPYTDKFDGMHLLFSKLNGTVENVKFVDDTLHANIALNGYEKSGLEIKKLKANLKLTPKIMEFKNLALETNRSKLGNYFAMEYNDFIPDFNDFISKVSLNSNFKNSYIN